MTKVIMTMITTKLRKMMVKRRKEEDVKFDDKAVSARRCWLLILC